MSSRGIEKRWATSSGSSSAVLPSPQAARRWARSDCRTPNRSGATGPAGRSSDELRAVDPALAREGGRVARVPLRDEREGVGDPRPELGRLERHGAAVLPQHPADERLDARVAASRRRRRRACRRPRACGAPTRPCRPARAIRARRRARRSATAAARGGPRRRSRRGSRKSRSRRVAKRMSERMRETRKVRIAARSTSWPITYQTPSSSRSAYGLTLRSVSRSRAGEPVPEGDRPLLRDRRLELREATGELGRVVGRVDAHALGRVGRRVAESRASEGEVLQREPERLGVGELALEVVERGLQRRELVVVELELIEEVVLLPKRVELLAGELVAVRGERHPERRQLGPVRVEPARERLVGHVGVALDVRLHVAGGQRPALGHEEGDERELADELVGIVGHR